jgi:hypothetical protein
MSRRPLSLWDFLERHFARRKNDAYLASLREQLDRSELLLTMEGVADAINEKAGDLLIEVQSYLPPEALVRSFSFRKADKDYILQLESWGPRPTLVFLMRQWRGPLFLSSFGWIYRLFGVEEYVIDVTFSSLLRAEDVSEADVEGWFIYLISEFDHAFVPSVPKDSVSEPQRAGKQPEPVWRSLTSSDE